MTCFPYPWEDVGGIVWEGASLWAASKDWMMLEGLHKLDAEGNIIASYLPFGKLPEPFGLTYDGTNRWYLGRECFGVAFKLYKVGEL